jgi:hypothetical protein
VSRGVALAGGLRVTLVTPVTWPLALAAFLIRGGIVLLVLPIVVLPTPVGLGDALGPTLTAVALGSPPPEAFIWGGLAIAGVALWLLGGGWLAAALEAEGARIVASDGEIAAQLSPAVRAAPGSARESGTARRILAARLIANIPLLAVLAWGSVRLVATAYGELTRPLDVSTPIVVRVLLATPEVIAALLVTWMVGEMVGAVAARRIALAGDGAGRALGTAVGTCLRHPLSSLARFWIPTLILVAVVLPSAIAAGAAWAAASAGLDEQDDPLRALVSVVALAFLWIVGLLLASVVCAWRSAAWTVAEVLREGTFGGSPDRRPGDWRGEGSSATL